MSWDIPTGDKCPECGEAIVKTARESVKCGNKECSYRVKAEKTGKTEKAEKTVRAIPLAEDFDVPPLMDEPPASGGYIFEGIEDEV